MRPYLTIHHKIQEIVALLLSVIALIITLVVANTLGDDIPVHWDLFGNADRYGSATEFLIFPIMTLVVVLVLIVCVNFLPIRLLNIPVKPKQGREALIYRDTAYLLTLYGVELAVYTLVETIAIAYGTGTFIAASPLVLIVVMVITFVGVIIKCLKDNR